MAQKAQLIMMMSILLQTSRMKRRPGKLVYGGAVVTLQVQIRKSNDYLLPIRRDIMVYTTIQIVGMHILVILVSVLVVVAALPSV
jgi:hypothetical protein